MGAQWKQAGREANAQKKGQMTAKLVREIMVAAKLGGPDPDLNPRLAAAVEKAKKASVYRDTIERAIKKGSGQTEEKVTFELVIYEGFAPHKVPVIVECLTDSRNRTAPESAISSRLAPSASPAVWRSSSTTSASLTPPTRTPPVTPRPMPSKPARRNWSRSNRKRFLRAEGRAVPDRDQGSRPCFQSSEAAGWNMIAAELRYLAKSFPELNEAARKEVVEFLNALDDHDDVIASMRR